MTRARTAEEPTAAAGPSRETGLGSESLRRAIRTERARRRRRRWILIGALAATAILLAAGVYVVTLPPTPPFRQLWSENLVGNAYGQGVGVGAEYVTYSYSATDLAPGAVPGTGQTADLTFQIQGIDVASGTVAWSSSFFLAGVIDSPPEFLPTMVAAGTDALLAVSWDSASGAYLTVVSVDASTGTQLAEWTVPLPYWASTIASQDLATTAGTLVTWLPRTLTSPTPLVVSGFNVSTGNRTWNDSIPIPLSIDGWGTGITNAVRVGNVLEISVAPAGTLSWLVAIDGDDGTVLGQRTYNGSADISQAVGAGGDFEYLASEPGRLDIEGFDVSSGLNLTPIPVDNVGDNSTGSAALYSVDGVLVVASYSPVLSYAAYDAAEGRLWLAQFPNATSCGQPDYQALGPCATDLNPPLPLAGGLVLLSAEASLMAPGDTYQDTYRTVDVQTGDVGWSASYALTFGYQFWPWQSPEPADSVEATVGNFVVYAEVSPASIALAGGTT